MAAPTFSLISSSLVAARYPGSLGNAPVSPAVDNIIKLHSPPAIGSALFLANFPTGTAP